MTATCRCGRHWAGLAQAHCPTCHEHFSSVANFDRHRPGTGGCQDPATMTDRSGQRVFKAITSPLGSTWARAGEYGGPRSDGNPAKDI